MIHAQKVKNAIMVLPVALGTDAVTGVVDTLGADYVTVKLIRQTSAAADIATTMKLSHGDTTSAYTDITNAVGGTNAAGGFIIPAGNTNTGDILAFFLDRNKVGLKRHVQITLVGDATTCITTVIAELERLKEGPDSAADQGLKLSHIV
jgi:hypothetical protein